LRQLTARGRCIALLRGPTGSATPLALLTASLDERHRYGGRSCATSHAAWSQSASRKTASADEAANPRMEPRVAIDADFFRAAVAKLTTANKQGELLLTDLVAMAAQQGGVADVTLGRERAVRQ